MEPDPKKRKERIELLRKKRGSEGLTDTEGSELKTLEVGYVEESDAPTGVSPVNAGGMVRPKQFGNKKR